MRGWVLAVVACGSMAGAQDVPPVSQAGGIAQKAVDRGDYMAAYRVLQDAVAAAGPRAPDPYTQQMWQQITPMLTGELPLDGLARWRPAVSQDAAATAKVRAAVARPAIAEIVRRARVTSIVILNEAHYSPRDRAFALEVARALKPLGYRNLAIEAINSGTEPGSSPALVRLIADGVVTQGTGFYTHDPVFANFISQAIRLGYTPVQYESTDAQNARGPGIQPREDGQAENLQTFLQAQPGAKLLVYVGHGQVSEVRPDGNRRAATMMAERLKQLTSIDPLTINQTALTDLQPALRDAYALAATKAGTRDIVLFEGDRPLLLPAPSTTDLQVVHPARAYRYGRPTWLAALGGRPVAVPATLLPKTGERLVQAFAADAPADAVPLDQVLVTAGRSAPSLMLPRGVRVRYAVQQ